MKVKVRFRFNKVTGEVELFQVEDTGPVVLPLEEHNRHHDQIAAEVGNVLERNPDVTEVLPGSAPVQTKPTPAQTEPTQTDEQPTERKPASTQTQGR